MVYIIHKNIYVQSLFNNVYIRNYIYEISFNICDWTQNTVLR